MTTAWILSDLHVDGLREWDDAILRGPHPDCDVIIMAGDIANGDFDVVPWLQETFSAEELGKIVYVPGNHDFWGTDAAGYACRIPLFYLGVNVIDRAVVEIAGRRIVGATLWTPLDVSDRVLSQLNDLRMVPDFTPELWRWEHERAVEFLRETIQPGDIVVTHHSPSMEGLDGGMLHNPRLMPYAGAYASRLDDLIEEKQPALWVHGHTHMTLRYQIGSVPVVTNARGPIGMSFDPFFTVELPDPMPKLRGF